MTTILTASTQPTVFGWHTNMFAYVSHPACDLRVGILLTTSLRRCLLTYSMDLHRSNGCEYPSLFGWCATVNYVYFYCCPAGGDWHHAPLLQHIVVWLYDQSSLFLCWRDYNCMAKPAETYITTRYQRWPLAYSTIFRPSGYCEWLMLLMMCIAKKKACC